MEGFVTTLIQTKKDPFDTSSFVFVFDFSSVHLQVYQDLQYWKVYNKSQVVDVQAPFTRT